MPELVILQALSAPVERDGWAWLHYALSIVATVTGIVVFSHWALERRRRPEVRFYWRLSPDGDSTHLANWGPDEVPEIKAGQPLLVGAAIQNTGDKAGSDTLINLVAPDCFDLRKREEPEQEPAHSGNATAGLPPDNSVVFFAQRVEPWAPPHWHMRYYRLKYMGDPPVQPYGSGCSSRSRTAASTAAAGPGAEDGPAIGIPKRSLGDAVAAIALHPPDHAMGPS